MEKFVDSPVENPIGQEWIESELERRGVATLEPGGATGFRGSKKSADTHPENASGILTPTSGNQKANTLTFNVLKLLEEEGYIKDGEDNIVHAEKAFFAARVMKWIRDQVQDDPDFNLPAYLTMLMYYKLGDAELNLRKTAAALCIR